MTRKMIKILLAVLSLLLVFSLFACNTTPDTPAGDNGDDAGNNTPPNEDEGENNEGGENGGDGGNTDAPAGDIDWDNTGLEGLALIYNSVARFQVVYTSESGAKALALANDLVEKLRGFGVEIADPVADTDADKVSEYEIIIGLGARGRGDDCNVSYRAIGDSGYSIKTLSTKVVIAAGNDNLLNSCYSNYVKNQMKITNKTKKLTELAVPADYTVGENTDYLIDSIKVGGVDLANYTLIIDVPDAKQYGIGSVTEFREKLFKNSGYWLEVGTVENMDSYEKKFIISCNGTINAKFAEDGIRAYVADNGDFVVECTYPNKFNEAFLEFATATIYDVQGNINYTKSSPYKDVVSRVYYSEFGAYGNGSADDYQAMYDAHIFANQCGQTVCADPGENVAYYVHVFHNGQIPVKTNVDLGTAKIIIDDRGSEVYAQRSKPLYNLVSDNAGVSYNEKQVKDTFGNVTLAVGQSNIPWLVDVLEADSLVLFKNNYHKDFVRNGGNQDSGYARQDIIMIDVNGNVYEDTPIIFEFDRITQINIYRTDDAPITFHGGNFETICCTVVQETQVNKYHSYQRGINVNRSNAMVTGVTHRMTGEPDLDTTLSKYGTRKESYPYHAFLQFNYCYNSGTQGLDLTGHATYYEDKSTSSNPVPMGSYDFVLGACIKITFTDLEQNGVPIHDSKYWGIMASNGVKNISFINCEMSRFDAHRGFWNGTLIDCTIGHTINVIGGGLMTCTNVTRMTGDNFMTLRGDYGATFEGDMVLTNCTLSGYASYDSRNGVSLSATPGYQAGYIVKSGYDSVDEEYLNWDFGFVCYMPQNMYIDNFRSGISSISVFNKIGDKAFDTANSNTYVLTKQITFKNMNRINISPENSGCTVLDSIPTKTDE